MSDSPNYPASTIARLLNLTERRLQQLAKDGIVPKAERGQYPLIESVQGYVKYLQDRTAGRERDPDEIQNQRGELLRLQSELAKLDLEERRGELVRVLDWERKLIDKVTGLRDALDSVADRVAPVIAAESDQAVVYRLLREELRETLKILAGRQVTETERESV